MKNKAPVFTVDKKHAWRDHLLRWVGLVLVVLVVAGTAIWILVSSNFSIEKLSQKLIDRLKPQLSQKQEVKVTSKEEELKLAIEKSKVLEIESITKTAEGDLYLKAKNGPQVIFAVEKSLTDQLATLQNLLTKAKIDNKALKKVDFRFDKTVVEY